MAALEGREEVGEGNGAPPNAGLGAFGDGNGAPPNAGSGALTQTAQAALARLVADHLPVMVAYYDAVELRCQYANRPYADNFDLDESAIVGRTFEAVIGEAAAGEVRPILERLRATLQPALYERRLPDRNGRPRWIQAHLLPHLSSPDPSSPDPSTPDPSSPYPSSPYPSSPYPSSPYPSSPFAPTALGVFVLLSDITRFRLAEEAVRESEERLGKFMQASAEGIVFQEDGLIVDANEPILQLTGYSLAELVGRPTLDLIAPDEVARVAAATASGAETQCESALVDRHGERIPVEFIGRTMLRHGEHLQMTIVRDIRDRQAAQARIRHLAHHDPLTGLANRSALLERLEHSIVGSRLTQARLALLFIDLDHFKRVNDSLGHPAGDALLCTVAARITGSLRTSDIVARFGGDEFVVLLSERRSGNEHEVDVEEVARKLIAAIAAPLDTEGRVISVTPSIGIALYPTHGTTPAELVKNADSAMYLAKSRGRANFQFFDASHASAALAALVLESELAEALQRGEFELYFQPQVDTVDGRVLGAEALIRWNHPARGLLGADAFIPVAEERQLMLPIGQWVMREALRCAERWQEMALGLGPIAVNLSNIQFQSIGFVEAVAQVLPVAGIGPVGAGSALIELELTERMLMDDLAQVKPRLAHLKAMGLQISIDDFGTGYSSLGHLRELPIDKLKIDRSFVNDLPEDRNAAAIIRAIIQMGQSLGMTVVAEGVETMAQRDFLAAQGCDQLQGLLLGGPMRRQDFETWVRANRARPAFAASTGTSPSAGTSSSAATVTSPASLSTAAATVTLSSSASLSTAAEAPAPLPSS